jgi:hypothetical protein
MMLAIGGRVGVGRNIKSLVELAATMRARKAEQEARRRQRETVVGDRPDRSSEPGIASPPPEQLRAGTFAVEDITDKGRGGVAIAIGKAYRRKPMIDVLLAQELLTRDEHKALKHYRHHADIADRSLVRDSLNRQRGGSNGPTVTILNAVRIRDDCERAAGALVDILRAVVVYDHSLSQWAMDKAGAVEQCRDRKGKRICQMEPRKSALATAKLEIRVAAQRVMAELDA